jgi:hypothetical protein
MQIVIPIYNNQGLRVAESEFRPYIHSGDVFMVVSGNFGGPLNIRWVSQTARALKKEYTNAVIMAGTGGLSNVTTAAEELSRPVEGVVYIYEPNLPHEPEFSWDFDTTLNNLAQAYSVIHTHGMIAVAKPTGRPLLQRNLLRYNWDYGEMARSVDEMFVQMQTYCKSGRRLFGEAFDKVQNQFVVSGDVHHWVPEISVDLGSPNGVLTSRAVSCVKGSAPKGLNGVLMWWSPKYPGQAVGFLKSVRPVT